MADADSAEWASSREAYTLGECIGGSSLSTVWIAESPRGQARPAHPC